MKKQHERYLNQYMHKKDLRESFSVIRAGIDTKHSAAIQNKLFSLPEYKAAESIFVYVSFGTEIDTKAIIENCFNSEKKVYAPKCIRGTHKMKALRLHSFSELCEGAYKIPEPPESSDEFTAYKPSLIICPGLAFTVKGERLGYGGGYYDRFLTAFSKKAPIAALCYEEQITDVSFSEKTDIKMDIIITQERIIRTV